MKEVVKLVATVLYICCLCYIVFFARRRVRMQEVSSSDLVNVTPVVNQISTFRELNKLDRKEVWHYATNLVGNILLFLPLPVLLYANGVRKYLQILVAALLVSLSIEIIQYLLVIGVADIDDVLLNFAGALSGVLMIRYSPVSVKAKLC